MYIGLYLLFTTYYTELLDYIYISQIHNTSLTLNPHIGQS